MTNQRTPTGRSVEVEITVIEETPFGYIFGVRMLGETNDIFRAFQRENMELRRAYEEAIDALLMYHEMVMPPPRLLSVKEAA